MLKGWFTKRRIAQAVKKTEPMIIAAVRVNFDTQGQHTWPPLKPRTIAEKKRLGYPSTPLVRTGALRKQIRHPKVTYKNGNIDVTIAQPEYWQYHQTGTARMPKRPPIMITDRQAKRIGEQLAKQLGAMFKQRHPKAKIRITG